MTQFVVKLVVLWCVPLSANLHEVVDPGQQLGVDGESAVEFVPWLSHQALSKLPLEHKNRAPGCTR